MCLGKEGLWWLLSIILQGSQARVTHSPGLASRGLQREPPSLLVHALASSLTPNSNPSLSSSPRAFLSTWDRLSTPIPSHQIPIQASRRSSNPTPSLVVFPNSFCGGFYSPPNNHSPSTFCTTLWSYRQASLPSRKTTCEGL